MKKNRFICILIVMVLTLCFALPCSAAVEIGSSQAVLIDGDTGQILYGKSPYTLTSSGSFNKLLNIITAIEYKDAPEEIDIITAALKVNTKVPFLGLENGQTVSVQDMLYAMYLGNYNDAANSVAVALGETLLDTESNDYKLKSDKQKASACVNAYVHRMNLTADKLFCTTMKATNADGNYYDTQQGSALDIAHLILNGCSNKEFQLIFRTDTYKLMANKDRLQDGEGNSIDAWVDPKTIDNYVNYDNESNFKKDKLGEITLTSSNKLVNGAIEYSGIKGGMYTYNPSTELYHCAVLAENKGRKLIAVVLNGDENGVYDDIETLLDFGFYNWYRTEIKDNEIASYLPSSAADYDLAFTGERKFLLPKNTKITDLDAAVSYSENNFFAGNIFFSLPNDEGYAGNITSIGFYEKNEKSKILPILKKIFIILIILAVIIGIIFFLKKFGKRLNKVKRSNPTAKKVRKIENKNSAGKSGRNNQNRKYKPQNNRQRTQKRHIRRS